MQIVNTEQMLKIEKQSENLGVSRKELMQNAGVAIAKRVLQICKPMDYLTECAKIVFLAGNGNNGGDCFAAAKILSSRGYISVTVINLVKKPSTELAKEQFSLLPDRVNVITGYNPDNLSFVRSAIANADVLIDGVFGTGFKGSLDHELIEIFSFETRAYKIAIDIPSGGNASSGNVSEGCFIANETLCLGCLKFGMTQYPLKKYCGKIIITDIDIPLDAYSVVDNERGYFLLDKTSLAGFPRKRSNDAHKGSFGTALVIGGSNSMRGAAALAALGALRSGAGLVKVASVGKCIDTVSTLAPESTYIEINSDRDGFMSLDADTKKLLLKAIKKSTAIVVGMGMGVTNDTKYIVRFVLENALCPVIVDADGINCIASDINILSDRKCEVILTPHPGEMARLMKCSVKSIAENRLESAEKFAATHGVTVVLKGAGTIIADKNSTSANHTGNPGMSKGGSGDVLAGIIASAAAQGIPTYSAACAGVYIHGLAGDKAAEKYEQEAMLPRDIVNCLSDAFRILKK
ncbi:MAG: NAD(P)H-hydrate dehydratase [Ruminococcus sp.]|nr:NAD(P)H-hydrate dehydratase [Ruminococcus sp.]